MNMQDILDELDVHGIINAYGNLTVLGGNVLNPDVVDAMREAATLFLDMPNLLERAGKYIAKLVDAESAYITSGGAAAMVSSVASCMTGGDVGQMVNLPRTERMRNEIIIQQLHRNIHDYYVEIAGGKIITVGDENGTSSNSFSKAITSKTAASLYFAFDPLDGVLPLEDVIKISHERGIPVIVDAAAELPPPENLGKFTEIGADLVIFSGGKDLGAPNDTGLILGRKELVDICRRLGPFGFEYVETRLHSFIGRPMKVSKEDVFAILAALTRYLTIDHGERFKRWDIIVDYFVRELTIQGVTASKEGVPEIRPPSTDINSKS